MCRDCSTAAGWAGRHLLSVIQHEVHVLVKPLRHPVSPISSRLHSSTHAGAFHGVGRDTRVSWVANTGVPCATPSPRSEACFWHAGERHVRGGTCPRLMPVIRLVHREGESERGGAREGEGYGGRGREGEAQASRHLVPRGSPRRHENCGTLQAVECRASSIRPENAQFRPSAKLVHLSGIDGRHRGRGGVSFQVCVL